MESEAALDLDALGASLMSQGAEARVFALQFLERPAVVKQRFTKKYRHPTLDAKLTKLRLAGEARALLKARKLGVVVPTVLHVEPDTSCLYLERIAGRSVKARLQAGDMGGPEQLEAVMAQVGRAVALLHDGHLVHGDLTTSNMMLRESDGVLALIDFGLAYTSTLTEDKAVDLYVLERAFSSAHSALGPEQLFDAVLASYRKHSRGWSATLNKFAAVRQRGRKRTMVG